MTKKIKHECVRRENSNTDKKVLHQCANFCPFMRWGESEEKDFWVVSFASLAWSIGYWPKYGGLGVTHRTSSGEMHQSWCVCCVGIILCLDFFKPSWLSFFLKNIKYLIFVTLKHKCFEIVIHAKKINFLTSSLVACNFVRTQKVRFISYTKVCLILYALISV